MPGHAGRAVIAKPAAVPPPTITEIQQVRANGTSTAPSVTISAASAGNHLIAVLGANDNTLAQITNPAGFTTAVDVVRATNANASRQAWAQAAGGETTITFTLAVSGSWRLTVFEYDGMAASPVDRTSSTTGGSSTNVALPATSTTTQADELAIVAVQLSNTSDGGVAFTDSFVLESIVSTNTDIIGSRVLNATQAVSTTVSWTTARSKAATLATYKAA